MEKTNSHIEDDENNKGSTASVVVIRGAENGKIGKKVFRKNCLLSDSFGLGNTQNLSSCPIFVQLFMPMVKQCFVQQFNSLTVL